MQAWAEALRNPRIMATLQDAYAAMRELLTEVVRRCQADGRLDPHADAEQLGSALFGLLPGYLLQRLVFDATVEDYQTGVRAILR